MLVTRDTSDTKGYETASLIQATVGSPTDRNLERPIKQVDYIDHIQDRISVLFQDTVNEYIVDNLLKINDVFVSVLCEMVDSIFLNRTTKQSSNDLSRRFDSLIKTPNMPLKTHVFGEDLSESSLVRVYIKIVKGYEQKGSLKQMAPALGITFSINSLPIVYKVARLRPVLHKKCSEEVLKFFKQEFYRANDIRDGNEYVLKMLDYVEYDSKSTGTKKAIIYTEYFEYNLESYIKSWLSIKVDSIFSSLIEGLSRIHAKGFVHGDIKSINILVSKKGTLKYCDFEYVHPLTSFEKFGTLNYVPPELFEDWCSPKVGNTWSSFKKKFIAKEIDQAKVDIWALGCVFFFVLTKRYPPWTIPVGVFLRLKKLVSNIKKEMRIPNETKDEKNNVSEQPPVSSKKSKWCVCAALQADNALPEAKSMEVQNVSAIGLQGSNVRFLGDMSTDFSGDLKGFLESFKQEDRESRERKAPLFLHYKIGPLLRELDDYLLSYRKVLNKAHLNDLNSLKEILYKQLNWIWKVLPGLKFKQNGNDPFIQEYYRMVIAMLMPDPSRRISIEQLKQKFVRENSDSF